MLLLNGWCLSAHGRTLCTGHKHMTPENMQTRINTSVGMVTGGLDTLGGKRVKNVGSGLKLPPFGGFGISDSRGCCCLLDVLFPGCLLQLGSYKVSLNLSNAHGFWVLSAYCSVTFLFMSLDFLDLKIPHSLIFIIGMNLLACILFFKTLFLLID